MSGKFKKDIARSQTLSQISCFSDQFGKFSQQLNRNNRYGSNSKEQQTLGSQLLGSIENKTASLHLPYSNNSNSIRMSPMRAQNLCESLMDQLNFQDTGNITSDYDLDKRNGNVDHPSHKHQDDAIQSANDDDDDIESSDSLPNNNNCTKTTNPSDPTNPHESKQQIPLRTRASIFKPSANAKIDGSSLFGDVRLDASSQLGGNHADELFYKMMHGHKGQGQSNQLGSNFSQKGITAAAAAGLGGLAASTMLNTSIIYNSCQIDMSCSVSLRIINEVRRNEQRAAQLRESTSMSMVAAAAAATANATDDDSENTLSTTPSSMTTTYLPSEEKQKEVILEFTQATISRVNYLNTKVNEYERRMLRDKRIQRKARAFIANRLRFVKRLPYVSTSIPSPPSPTSSQRSFNIFHSNQACVVQRHAHFVSKISLNIDSLQTRDICMSTDESFSFVTPLDQHFPNVILIGTISGKLLLFSLSKETNTSNRKYVLKFAQQIYKKQLNTTTTTTITQNNKDAKSSHSNDNHEYSQSIEAEEEEEEAKQQQQRFDGEQVYATCAVQVKAVFYLGSSDGSVLIYDFKKKQVIQTIHNIPILQPQSPREYHEINSVKQRDLHSESANTLHASSSLPGAPGDAISSQKQDIEESKDQRRNNNLNTSRSTAANHSPDTSSTTKPNNDRVGRIPSTSSDSDSHLNNRISSSITLIEVSNSSVMIGMERGIVHVFDMQSPDKKWISNQKDNPIERITIEDAKIQNETSYNNNSIEEGNRGKEEIAAEEIEDSEDAIIKCQFSPMSNKIVLLLTESEFRVVYTPLNKVIFAKSPNVQEFMTLSDFAVNSVTQEVVLLSHNALLNQSKLEILSFRAKGLHSHRLRTLDSMTVPYVIHSVLFDKNQQNLFCFTANEVKLWLYYNKQEAQSISSNLLEKFQELEDILTPPNCSPARH